MILNMHIRKDYNTWIEQTDKSRVTTMCGKMTTPKFAGIPSVTQGQHPLKVDDDYAWCIKCCNNTLLDTNWVIHSDIGPVSSLYQAMRGVCFEQLNIATSVK